MAELSPDEIRFGLEALEIIGKVVSDFHPLKKFYLVYGQKRISLGEQVSCADVQRQSDFLDYDDNGPESHEIFQNSTFVLVITEPDPDDPSIQHLHWMVTDVTATDRDGRIVLDLPGRCLFDYQPPRPMDSCMMVFTLFKQNASQFITRPIFRQNFSTIHFARSNGLGPPLFAGFFFVENEYPTDNIDSSTGSSQGTTRKRKKNKTKRLADIL